MTNASRDEARRRLILALDVPDLDAARALLDRLAGQVGLVKVGLELFTACGPEAVRVVKACGYEVFLDLKLHDIPNTVAGAVRSAMALDVAMLTLHAAGGREMIAKAREAAGDRTMLLGVTLLTSLGAEDLGPGAMIDDPSEVVRRRAVLAATSGCGGIVCSPQEVAMVRAAVGPATRIITPGIRPAGAEMADQKRAATPGSAIADGSDYLVIGRPISGAPDPAAAASRIVDEIADALAARG